jgi:prepilin-type N-terminal cleavage/methylation domain-containing protein
MIKITANKNKGFTLIELLVVIAIIGLLSSIMFASLSSARAKARDAKRISELGQISKALNLYFDKYGTYPNYPTGEVTTNPYIDNFTNMANQLVAEGFINKVPGDSTYIYNYKNYGPNTTAGALLVITSLETVAASPTGKAPSCRINPTLPQGWCSTSSSTQYCLCHPYQ